MTGKSLSHYKILDELGRGGMGIVFKARDTKLDRVVALKVLPSAALSSDDDRARFYREAKAAAQLHHPNIASVFEIDEAVPEGAGSDDLRPFIAMEFIDGGTLEDIATAGPLKLEDAVAYTAQIASALEAAHEKEIVHRDIKSANVMLTSKGVAKVLDFGLAKTVHSTMLTQMGSTVGTFSYMSPEQTRGENVDHRTDLWALGVVLYELVSGRLPFRGDYEQAITYSILNEEPEPLTAIRTGVPMGLEWIVSKLLAKNPDDRYQSATDLLVDLRTVDLKSSGMSRASVPAVSKPVGSSIRQGSAAQTKTGNARVLVAALAGAAFVAVLAMLWPRSEAQVTGITPKRLIQEVVTPGSVQTVSISKQGDKVAFATDVINVLDLRTGNVRSYEQTGVFVHLDFSADGKSLLVTTAADIQRLDLDSGSAVQVIETREGGPRARWAGDDYIVYEEMQSAFGYSLVTSESRRIVILDSLNGEYDLDFPTMLPDGKTLMATAEFRNAPSRIGFWDLESGENLGYVNYEGYRAHYIEPGYLIFSLNGDAMALPFDLKRLEPVGAVVAIEKGVRMAGLSVSNEGTLVHAGNSIGQGQSSGPVIPVVIQLFERSATNLSSLSAFPPGYYRNVTVSPDGRKAAVVIVEPDRLNPADIVEASDIWILDLETYSRRTLTRNGRSDYPAWSTTGDSIFFIDTSGNDKILAIDASGRGGAETVMESAVPSFADLAISPDGRWAVMAEGLPPTIDIQSTIRVWDFTQDATLVSGANRIEFASPNGNPRHFDFSPDGKYFAYEDQGAIFVQSIDHLTSTPYEVYENSHELPRWSPDGTYLYTSRTSDGRGEAVPVQTDPVFNVTGPSERRPGFNGASAMLDVFPDGERFITAFPDASAAAAVAADTLNKSLNLSFIINLTDMLSRE